MKKVLLSLVVLAAVGMTSCGGDDVCSCLKDAQKMSEEAGDDADKQKEAQEKSLECLDMVKDMSEEEIEAEMKDCDLE